MLHEGLQEMHHRLEHAAERTLAKIIGSKKTLKPLYLQPDRAIFLASDPEIILKVYVEGHMLQREHAMMRQAQARGIPVPEFLMLDVAEISVLAMRYIVGKPLSSKDIGAAREAGMYIEQFHGMATSPRFSGGQNHWHEFIAWWSNLEIANIEELGIFTDNEITQMTHTFDAMRPTLIERPIRLLHGDLQAGHILVDPQTQRVVAFLDFADAQPGDPLLDIAVLSLWDVALADRVLLGYTSIENDELAKQLLSQYRLLRHISEVPWLVRRGFTEKAERNIQAIREQL